MGRRFDVGCLIALLPRESRAVALREVVEADPDYFRIGHDHPPLVVESATADGTLEVRQALARVTNSAEAQARLFAMDDPGIDFALADNMNLPFELESRLRLRAPAAVATGRGYNSSNHSRALQSADADLAAAALIDRRTRRWTPPLRPTVWATGWRTVRLAGGVEKVREVLAALPADAPLDDVTVQIAEACAEADPEPFLSTAEERFIGTGALLRRLSAVRARTDDRLAEQILGEPFQVDWSLVSAVGLARRLPRMAAKLLAGHPACPADVRFALLEGRPAPAHLKQDSNAPNGAPTVPEPPRPPYLPPYYWPPPDAGPLGHGNPLSLLARTPVDKELTIEHLWSALELELVSAADAVEIVRPALTVTCYAGQSSSFAAHRRRPTSGQARLNAAAVDYLKRRAAERPTVPGMWRNVYTLIRSWTGTLPELLDAAEG